jgi:hypothetical protein
LDKLLDCLERLLPTLGGCLVNKYKLNHLYQLKEASLGALRQLHQFKEVSLGALRQMHQPREVNLEVLRRLHQLR